MHPARFSLKTLQIPYKARLRPIPWDNAQMRQCNAVLPSAIILSNACQVPLMAQQISILFCAVPAEPGHIIWRRLLQTCAIEVEPLSLAVWIVASYHWSSAGCVAVTIYLLVLVLHLFRLPSLLRRRHRYRLVCRIARWCDFSRCVFFWLVGGLVLLCVSIAMLVRVF
jgi:hypothetical protein